jgi:hypothetical protein
MMTNLYIGNDKLDLFKDESIEVTSSVANINDITKNMTDYSRSFTVPATHVNNRIFKHYYDANIDNAFDARVKHGGKIELDGLPFKYGKWKLEKVEVRKGDPYAYTLTFFGNLVSLKDKLKNFELKDLDLSDYNHSYSSANVKTGLSSSLFSGAVIYNLLSKKQLYYKSGSDNTNTDKLANIAYTGGANTGVNYDYLKPSIQILKIIEAIENDFNLVFTRDFFGSTEFQNLYLWVNNTSAVTNTDFAQVDFTNIGDFTPFYGEIDVVNNYVTIPTGVKKYASITITPSVGYENTKYTIERKINDNVAGVFSNLKGINSPEWRSDDGEKHSYYVYSQSEFKFTSVFKVRTLSYGTKTASFPQQIIANSFKVALNMPKIKLIDFLNGLFKMFKLIVIADEYDNIYIDTFDNYYSKGKVYNITKYVKTDTLEVSRGNLLNEIKFNYKEPNTLLNNQFKINTRQGYGDEEILLTDDGTPSGTPLEGDSLQIELPFEQIIYERLPDLTDGFFTNIMYGGIFNEKIEPVSPEAHIFYNINLAIGSKTIGFIKESGVKEVFTGNINTPSHSIDFAQPDFNLSFGIENNEWTNIASEKTLYYNHYSKYIESIFNIKRRSFAYKAILPLRILLRLQLNDVLEIKNNYYRIDNYSINLLTREVSLNLINSFDLKINGMSSNVSELYADYRAQRQSISVTNLGNPSFNIESGTWLTLSYSGNNVYFDFDANAGATRTTNVLITNLESLQTVEIFVTQTGV